MADQYLQIDEQTFRDLQIFADGEMNIASLFDDKLSQGGRLCLFRMLEFPVSDVRILEHRKTVLKYLTENPDFIEIDSNKLAFIEIYLDQEIQSEKFSFFHLWCRELKDKLKPENKWNICHRGVEMLVDLFSDLICWVRTSVPETAPLAVLYYRNQIEDLWKQTSLGEFLPVKKLTLRDFGRLDYIFRKQENGKVRELIKLIYELEVLGTVAQIGVRRGFCFPEYVEEENHLEIKDLYHPFLPEAVKNDFQLSRQMHVCFLTGPNMAGKSTYMKALGIAVFLAHVGFPVPASSMRISVFQGLFTTINLSDSINLGYSHYYSEVKRIKFVAEKIAGLKNVIVIFDELFRGTNVKDAYEASLAVISAFAGLHRSLFVISTHILEVAESLQVLQGICYRYFEVERKNGEFLYTYLLKPGVSEDRIGMYILNREKVIETIRKAEQTISDTSAIK